MPKAKTTLRYFISSLMGMMALFLLFQGGFGSMFPDQGVPTHHDLTFVADEEPKSEALNSRTFAFWATAVLGSPSPAPFTKPFGFFLNALVSLRLPQAVPGGSLSFFLQFFAFQVFPNAP